MPLLIYTVQPGDTVWKIANLYGSTVQEIARHNNMTNPDLILPGQTLLIPVSDNLRETPPGSLLYTVQPGDTLYILSLLFRVSIESILALNNIPSPFTIYPGMLIVLPPNAVNPFLPVQPGIIRYTVLPGDTVYRIASRFGISVQSILGENPGLVPERLFPGQVLTVPIPAAATAIYRGNPNRRAVALTFDATYGDNQTVRLLQILRDNNIKATFFLSGIWPMNYPELAQAIAREGHEIGNHSLTHPHMTQISQAEATNQLVRTNALIQTVTGVRPYLFRPPFGEYNQSLLNIAARLGFLTIMWTVDSLDWQNPGVAQIAERVVNNAVPGAIILMHQGAYQTPDALLSIIPRLMQLGYGFGTVTEVLNP
ncbi:MAG: LysM peptidoglycan-binding domain-containing protein [Clostridia bacterium]|jgi:polysaccharide deacetylase family sporulation protein PdaB